MVIVRRFGRETATGSAYVRELEGREPRFSLVDGVLVDDETGSLWDDGGRAVSGPMAGSSLTAGLPAKKVAARARQAQSEQGEHRRRPGPQHRSAYLG